MLWKWTWFDFQSDSESNANSPNFSFGCTSEEECMLYSKALAVSN